MVINKFKLVVISALLLSACVRQGMDRYPADTNRCPSAQLRYMGHATAMSYGNKVNYAILKFSNPSSKAVYLFAYSDVGKPIDLTKPVTMWPPEVGLEKYIDKHWVKDNIEIGSFIAPDVKLNLADGNGITFRYVLYLVDHKLENNPSAPRRVYLSTVRKCKYFTQPFMYEDGPR